MDAANYKIARPYAKAIFDLAVTAGNFDQWSQLLQQAKVISEQPTVKTLVTNPKVSRQQLIDLLTELLAGSLQQSVIAEQGTNFLKLLVDNKRLMALSAVSRLFELYHAEFKQAIEVEVISAMPLSAKQQEQLAQALTNRFKKMVMMNYQIDPSILGGAIIRANGLVIDGSVSTKLNRLQQQLTG